MHPGEVEQLLGRRPDAIVGGKRSPHELYFGHPLGGREQLARDTRWDRHFTLPKVYEGKNVFLGEVLVGLVEFDNTWPTSSMVAPIERTDQMAWKWHVWNFETPFLDRVPHEGVMRTFKTAATEQNARSVRRGIALDFEHGFHFTQMGRQHFVRLLQVIQNAIQNTMNMHVHLAILSAKDFEIQQFEQSGRLDKDVKNIFLDIARQAFALQKPGHSAKALFTRQLEIMSDRGVTPTLGIFPQGVQNYFAGVGDENLKYEEAGPAAIQRLNNPRPFNTNRFMGVPIKYVGGYRGFDASGRSEVPTNPYLRQIVIGGYHQMRDTVWMATNRPATNAHHRAIRVIDMNTDEYQYITLKQALKACKDYTFTGPDESLPNNFFGRYQQRVGNGKGQLTWGDLQTLFLDDYFKVTREGGGGSKNTAPSAPP